MAFAPKGIRRAGWTRIPAWSDIRREGTSSRLNVSNRDLSNLKYQKWLLDVMVK